jgi:hypothetical protein
LTAFVTQSDAGTLDQFSDFTLYEDPITGWLGQPTLFVERDLLTLEKGLARHDIEKHACNAKCPCPFPDYDCTTKGLVRNDQYLGHYATDGVVKKFLQTMLFQAAEGILDFSLYGSTYVASEGNLDLAALALACGADVNSCNIEGQTALHLAAISGAEGVASLLIEAGADINKRDCRGESPLAAAEKHDSIGVIELLIDHGAPWHKGSGFWPFRARIPGTSWSDLLCSSEKWKRTSEEDGMGDRSHCE